MRKRLANCARCWRKWGSEIAEYASGGFRNVSAESAGAAATIFAGRRARREFGRGGYVRNSRVNSWSRDGRSATVEACIGRDLYSATRCDRDRGTVIGRNVLITATQTGE